MGSVDASCPVHDIVLVPTVACTTPSPPLTLFPQRYTAESVLDKDSGMFTDDPRGFGMVEYFMSRAGVPPHLTRAVEELGNMCFGMAGSLHSCTGVCPRMCCICVYDAAVADVELSVCTLAQVCV